MDPSDAMCQFSISDFGKEAVLASKNATSMTGKLNMTFFSIQLCQRNS